MNNTKLQFPSWKDIGSQILDPAGGTIRTITQGNSAGGGQWEDFVDPGGFGLSEALGGKSTNPNNNPSGNPYADALARISEQLFTQTDPLRTALINRSNNFVNGGLDVTQSPMYGALKAAIDSQFGRAKGNVISSTPAGGSLTDALTNLETSRATDMTKGIGNLAQDEMTRAYGLATGLLPVGNGGLGTAANIQSQQMAINQQQQAQQKQALGSAAGLVAMMFL